MRTAPTCLSVATYMTRSRRKNEGGGAHCCHLPSTNTPHDSETKPDRSLRRPAPFFCSHATSSPSASSAASFSSDLAGKLKSSTNHDCVTV